MIEKIGRSKNSAGSIKKGVYLGVLEDIVDGKITDNALVEGDWLAFKFRLDSVLLDGQPYRHTEVYKNRLLGTATLPRVLEAIIRRPLTEDEKDDGVAPLDVINKPVQLEIKPAGRDRSGARKIELINVLAATPEQVAAFGARAAIEIPPVSEAQTVPETKPATPV
jgi:hypothetical protein